MMSSEAKTSDLRSPLATLMPARPWHSLIIRVLGVESRCAKWTQRSLQFFTLNLQLSLSHSSAKVFLRVISLFHRFNDTAVASALGISFKCGNQSLIVSPSRVYRPQLDIHPFDRRPVGDDDGDSPRCCCHHFRAFPYPLECAHHHPDWHKHFCCWFGHSGVDCGDSSLITSQSDCGSATASGGESCSVIGGSRASTSPSHVDMTVVDDGFVGASGRSGDADGVSASSVSAIAIHGGSVTANTNSGAGIGSVVGCSDVTASGLRGRRVEAAVIDGGRRRQPLSCSVGIGAGCATAGASASGR